MQAANLFGDAKTQPFLEDGDGRIFQFQSLVSNCINILNDRNISQGMMSPLVSPSKNKKR